MDFLNTNNQVLVVGADSNIGKNLSISLQNAGLDVWKTTRRKDDTSQKVIYLDLSEDSSSWATEINFDTVFFCAAVTSINGCEKDPYNTKLINVDHTVKLIRKLVAKGAFVIFLSTNAVFDGSISHVKKDHPKNPRSAYGEQKADAETLLESLNNSVSIIRLSKVISNKIELLDTWINKLKNGEVIKPFFDMFMAPVSLSKVIEFLTTVAQKKEGGISQLSATYDISYSDAAYHIAGKIGAGKMLIEPISYKHAGIPFSPKNTTFDAADLRRFKIEQPDPFAAIDEYLKNYFEV